MFKLVIFKREYLYSRATHLDQIKNATNKGFKKDWVYAEGSETFGVGGFPCSFYLNSFQAYKWIGSEDQYLLFKLYNESNLIIAHVDIEEDNTIWLNILQNYVRFKPVFYGPTPKANGRFGHFRRKQYFNNLSELSKPIYEDYLKLLEPIMEKLECSK